MHLHYQQRVISFTHSLLLLLLQNVCTQQSTSLPMRCNKSICDCTFAPSVSGGFSHVQRVRQSRGPTKRSPHRPQNVGQQRDI